MTRRIGFKTVILHHRLMGFKNPIGKVTTGTHRGSPNPLLRSSHSKTRGKSLRRISRAQSPSSGSHRVRGEIRNLRLLTHLRLGLSSLLEVGTVVLVGQGDSLSPDHREYSFRHEALASHVEPWDT